MPTEIKIVLPATNDDDAISTNGDTEANSSGKNNCRPRSESADYQNSSIAKNGTSDYRPTSPNHSPRRRSHISRRPPSARAHSRTKRNPLRQQQPSQQLQRVTQHSKASKTTLQQKQHHLSDEQATQRYIILDESPGPTRPSTVSGERDKKPSSFKPGAKSQGDARLSVTDTYDLDLEHRDIMVKALQSYTQYSRNDESNDANNKDNGNISRPNRANQRFLGARNRAGNKDRGKNERNKSPDANQSTMGYYPNGSLPDSSRQFQLSQCRLRFHDEDEPDKTQSVSSSSKRRSKSRSAASPTVAAMTTLYTLDGDGVLVDSVGHVYRSQRNRPWSALPVKFADQIKMSKWRLCQSNERRSDDYVSIDSASTSDKGESSSDISSHKPKVVTLRYKGKMSQPISHSKAYQRRNQTTHSWYDTSHLMSQSMPSASFLHRQYVGGSSASTPRSSRDAASEKASPAGKPTMARPSSSYSYDGGFFVGAHTGHADYFVIHPDWVSESMTIKKLSIGDKNNGPPLSPSARYNKSRYQNRRCMSAPPSKQRNPITWEPSNPIDIPKS